jgi:hypothetical protein
VQKCWVYMVESTWKVLELWNVGRSSCRKK